MTEKRWNEITSRCPGSWFWNRDDSQSYGTITVDADHALAALDYLRRKVSLQGIRPHQSEANAIVIMLSER